MNKAFIRATLISAGLLHTLTGLLMLVVPEWFFDNIGTFPPYNRHYTGDVGAFLLPLGLGLFWAAREPARHRLFIAMAVLANIVHLLNHVYDDVQADTIFSTQTISLIVFVGFLIAALWLLQQRPVIHAEQSLR
jgi:hypothetical protein